MISIIIPTRNAERYLPALLDRLKEQKVEGERVCPVIAPEPLAEAARERKAARITEIIVIDSESTDRTVAIAKEAGVRVISIRLSEFDHGGTRNLAWQQARGEYIFFLTQDALPVDEHYLQNMLEMLEKGEMAGRPDTSAMSSFPEIAPIAGEKQETAVAGQDTPARWNGQHQAETQDKVYCQERRESRRDLDESKKAIPPLVMVSGRQIARPDANPVEKLTRAFNYPKQSFVRDASAIGTMGIKAYFFSDACAVYRRSFLEEMGGFEAPILTNEDMLMAARALKKGYRIGYCAEAAVYHSHNFSLGQHYRRNFDVAAFLQMHEDEIASGGTTGEGIRMVLFTEKELARHLHLISMVRCVFESAAKLLGNRAGKKYKRLTKEQIRKRTSNPGYWRKQA